MRSIYSMKLATILAAPALAITAAPPLLAQGQLYEWKPIQGPRSLAAAGDLNADGANDWAVLEMITTGQAGVLRAFSGADGSELWSVASVPATDWRGEVTGFDDADQDGRDDLAVCGLGALRAVSGADGTTLWELSLPSSARAIARLNDVDLDGVADLGLGATTGPPGGPIGSAYVVSGRTGGVLHKVQTPLGATHDFGLGAGALGDFDGDGVHDFGVGDPSAQSGLGEVHAISGKDGSILASFTGPPLNQLGTGGYGLAIVSPGDLDGDFVPELAVSSPWECHAGPGGYEGCSNGVVRILSGATGAILLELRGWPYPMGTYPLSYGYEVDVIEDLDADGHADLLIAAGTDKFGCCHYSAGDVVAVSSATGE